MNITEVKAAVIQKLKALYPDTFYKYYGVTVVEGFKRPSFFIDLRVVDSSPVNMHIRETRATVYITIMQEKANEAAAFTMFDNIKNAIGLAVKVGSRYIKVTSFDLDFIGSEGVIPQMQIDLEWTDRIILTDDEHSGTAPIIENVTINETLNNFNKDIVEV